MCGGETAWSEPEQYQPGHIASDPMGDRRELGWEEESAAPSRHPPGVPGWETEQEIGITQGASLQPYSVVWKAIWIENEESLRKENGTEIKGV